VVRNRKDQNGRPGLNGASYNGPLFLIAVIPTTTGDPFADALLGNYHSTPKHLGSHRALPFHRLRSICGRYLKRLVT